MRPNGDLESSASNYNGLVRIMNAQPGGANTRSGLLRPGCLSSQLSVGGYARPDELTVKLEGGLPTVYVSFGPAGIFRYKTIPPNTSPTWDMIARGRTTPTSCATAYPRAATLIQNDVFYSWPAIDALVDTPNEQTLVVVGGSASSSASCSGGTTCPAIQKITVPWDASPTTAVASLVAAANVSSTLPNGTPWWHGTDLSGSDPFALPGNQATTALIGHSQWVTSQLRIAATSTPTNLTIFASGRGGVWRGTQTSGTQASGTQAWTPIDVGISNTFSLGSAVNPMAPNRVLSLDQDWQVLRTDDAFASNAPHQHKLESNIADITPTAVTSDDRGGAFAGFKDGQVWYNPNPYGTSESTNCWQTLGTPAGGSYPLALSAGPAPADPDNKVTVIAALKDAPNTSGLYRFTFTPGCAVNVASWTTMSGMHTIKIGDTTATLGVARVGLIYNWDTKNILAFDQNVGLTRAIYNTGTSAFGSLTQIVARDSQNDSVGDFAGNLAAGTAAQPNPNRSDTVYFDYQSSAYRVIAAGSCSSPCGKSPLTSGQTPANKEYGGITVAGDGKVVLASGPPAMSSIVTPGRLYKASTAGGTALVWVTSDADDLYSALGFRTPELTARPVAGDGTVFASTLGLGLVTSSP